MVCPKCKFNNDQEFGFCSACGGTLSHGEMRVHPRPEKTFVKGKNSFIATLISFAVPAGGQFYNGDFKKAAVLCLAYVVLAFLVVSGIFAIPALLIALTVWVFAIIDAHKVAKREKAIW
jgi:hypothetical protein